jgi:YesN/AraC family two-component response regulator
LVTGYSSFDLAVRSIQLPVIAYLVKPIELETLLAQVQNALEHVKMHHSVRNTQQRLHNWLQQLNEVEKSMELVKSTSPLPVEIFVTLTLQNITAGLQDLRHLTESLARHNHHNEKPVCRLFNCQRISAYEEAILETIEVLEKTKRSFKSRELGDLREKLEAIVKTGAT